MIFISNINTVKSTSLSRVARIRNLKNKGWIRIWIQIQNPSIIGRFFNLSYDGGGGPYVSPQSVLFFY